MPIQSEPAENALPLARNGQHQMALLEERQRAGGRDHRAERDARDQDDRDGAGSRAAGSPAEAVDEDHQREAGDEVQPRGP